MKKEKTILFFALVLLAVCAVYSNHFHNAFHFDDSHAVVGNPYIRDIGNIPHFFVDGTTFSALSTNQSYRPLVTASLAIDYWLADGLDPFFYHVSTFLWFLAQLALMYLLFIKLTDNRAVSLFITAWYGLHPVSAETVNYIIQRAEIMSTVGVVSAFVIYIYAPNLRKFGFYLIPILIGTLAKPLSIMFAPILFFYILFFERDTGLDFWRRDYRWLNFWAALKSSIPAFVACAALYWFQDRMTPKTFTPGGSSLSAYIITQPWVILHYVKTLFVPTDLTADSDMGLLSGATDIRAICGFLGVTLLIAAALVSSAKKRYQPIAFGILWFLIALVPTSVVPLAEVTNDHRMFFPFVGLILSACWAGVVLIDCAPTANKFRAAATLLAIAALPIYAYGTYQRNDVWHSEDSLWYDVTVKSPKNGRGLMNYGLTLMAKGEYQAALNYFERARELTPNYGTLETNLGIVKGALKRDAEAEAHFLRAVQLAPDLSSPYFFYGRWLDQTNRSEESAAQLENAITINPYDMDARHLLMKVCSDRKNWPRLRGLIEATLRSFPSDEVTLEYQRSLKELEDKELAEAQASANAKPTADNLLELSYVYYKLGRYEDTIRIANKALELKPDFAEAYNNIGSAYNSMAMWSEAIKAEESALRINPNYTLAKNNLSWAKQHAHPK